MRNKTGKLYRMLDNDEGMRATEKQQSVQTGTLEGQKRGGDFRWKLVMDFLRSFEQRPEGGQE